VVALVGNPSYLGGGDQGDRRSRPAHAKTPSQPMNRGEVAPASHPSYKGVVNRRTTVQDSGDGYPTVNVLMPLNSDSS
jgi:hypothetical protein